jgi:N4-(beta-N-acetylglucosaminyl)-L-asparaginase
MSTTRRDFLSAGAMVAVGMSGGGLAEAESEEKAVEYAAPARPVIVTRETGDGTIGEAYAMLARGGDTLDAALHICEGREDDASDHSVGLGGLPNEDGVVELDACVMHGPTRQAGSVAALPNIRHAARLARTVMERTGHVMIVGRGAEKFAVDEGFEKENLLTDDARKIWMLWKAHGNGWWGPGLDSPAWKAPVSGPGAAIPKAGLAPWGVAPRHPLPEDAGMVAEKMRYLSALAERVGIEPRLRREAVQQVMWPTTGTIHVSAVNAKGEMSGATTTSGLAWKIAGRVGDSPIIGAGCFTDQKVGSAGATGNGEENIKVAGAHTIVDQMRRGASPKEAGMEALRRIAANYNNDMTKLRYLDMIYYILRRDGAYAGVSLWSTRETGEPKKFVVHDGTQRTEVVDSLFQGTTVSVHPF